MLMRWYPSVLLQLPQRKVWQRAIDTTSNPCLWLNISDEGLAYI